MTDFASQEVQLSLIICSINPEQCAEAVKSMEETAGCRIEAIVIDNRERHWPIAKAYNEGAKQAKSKALLFTHEDVIIREKDWVKPLVDKLAEPSTGVIGFAGSKVWAPILSGWAQHYYYSVDNYAWVDKENRIIGASHSDFGDPVFVPVVTIDGFAMAVSKDVWEKHPFDEVVLTGFHCYDLDFSLTLANAGYTNYVWRGIQPIHLSPGNFGSEWAKMTHQLYGKKWRHMSNLSTASNEVDWSEVKAIGEHKWVWVTIRSLTPNGLKDEALRLVWGNRNDKYVKKHLNGVIIKWFVHRLLKVKLKRGKA